MSFQDNNIARHRQDKEKSSPTAKSISGQHVSFALCGNHRRRLRGVLANYQAGCERGDNEQDRNQNWNRHILLLLFGFIFAAPQIPKIWQSDHNLIWNYNSIRCKCFKRHDDEGCDDAVRCNVRRWRKGFRGRYWIVHFVVLLYTMISDVALKHQESHSVQEPRLLGWALPHEHMQMDTGPERHIQNPGLKTHGNCGMSDTALY